MGGRVALNLTLMYPECVSALVLVTTTVGGFSYSGPPSWVDELEEQIEAADAIGDADRVNELEVRKWVDGAGRTPDQVDQSVRAHVLTMNRYNIEIENPRAIPVSLDPPAVTRLGEIGVPTLIVVGDRDAPVTRASCALLAASISGACQVEMAGIAHLPCMERSAEFDAQVLGFL